MIQGPGADRAWHGVPGDQESEREGVTFDAECASFAAEGFRWAGAGAKVDVKPHPVRNRTMKPKLRFAPHPQAMPTQGMPVWSVGSRDVRGQAAGFTLLEIMIVLALTGLLIAIVVPNIMRSRETAQLNSILNNLRVIESAKLQYALDSRKGTGDSTDFSALSNYFKDGTIHPVVGESYTTESIGTAAVAKIGVRLAAYPAGTILTAP